MTTMLYTVMLLLFAQLCTPLSVPFDQTRRALLTTLATTTAIPTATNVPTNATSRDPLLAFFNSVPSYTLCTPTLTPYCVVNDDAKIVQYMFTSLQDCKSVLASCAKSDLKANASDKIYKGATIGKLPMSEVYLLSLLKNVKGQYYRFSPSPASLESALNRTNLESLPDGKVPLFFDDNLAVMDGQGEQVKYLYLEVRALQVAKTMSREGAF